jgi:hypothetical protein
VNAPAEPATSPQSASGSRKVRTGDKPDGWERAGRGDEGVPREHAWEVFLGLVVGSVAD